MHKFKFWNFFKKSRKISISKCKLLSKNYSIFVIYSSILFFQFGISTGQRTLYEPNRLDNYTRLTDTEIDIKILELEQWLNQQMRIRENDTKQKEDEKFPGKLPGIIPTLAPILKPNTRPVPGPNDPDFPTTPVYPTPSSGEKDSPVNFGVFTQFFDYGRIVKTQKATCDVATIVIGYFFMRTRQFDATEIEIETTALFMCRLAVVGGSTSDEVCLGLTKRMGPTFYFIAKERPRLTPRVFVGTVLQQIGCETPEDDVSQEWQVDLIRKKRIPRENETLDEYLALNDNKRLPEPKYPAKLTKIAHLADIHVDPLYVAGTNADCENNILCCHAEEDDGDDSSSNDTVGAGYFGDDRKCDTPWKTLELTLIHMKKDHPDIELFYMTGDLVPHNIWYTTREENTEIVEIASEMIYKHFPNTKVIPMLGNHEPHPVNFFSPRDVPSDLDTTWIYDVAAKSWSQWIPPDQMDNFLKAGFYKVDMPDKNLKIVAINSNICYGFNFWQLYEKRDPGGMLTWMRDELADSETKGQSVHIVGHVPPGSADCSKVWSREFYKIVSRYQKTVKGQWYGHTHYDEFKLYYDLNDKTRGVSVAWIGGSLTPYRVHNMAYKLYYADGGTGLQANEKPSWDIYDHETWIFDLKQANMNTNSELEWYRLYRASEAYGIDNTLPETMTKFVEKLAKERKTFDLFHQYYYKSAVANNEEECDTYCRKVILCAIVQPYYGAREECDNTQKMVDGVILPGLDPGHNPIETIRFRYRK